MNLLRNVRVAEVVARLAVYAVQQIADDGSVGIARIYAATDERNSRATKEIQSLEADRVGSEVDGES